MLTLVNLTVLYAQTGKDTTKQCYTQEELKRIADRVVYANECDTLLAICNQQSVEQNSALRDLSIALLAKDSIIQSKDNINLLKEDIIIGKDNEIYGLRNKIKKDKRKKTWLKIGWTSTSVVLTGILTYFIIN